MSKDGFITKKKGLFEDKTSPQVEGFESPSEPAEASTPDCATLGAESKGEVGHVAEQVPLPPLVGADVRSPDTSSSGSPTPQVSVVKSVRRSPVQPTISTPNTEPISETHGEAGDPPRVVVQRGASRAALAQPGPLEREGPADARGVHLGHGKVEAEVTDLNFHQIGSFKVGIVGGKATGKTYFFQSLVWRTQNPDASGALARFIRGGNVDLFQRIERTAKAARLSTRGFANEYRSWLQLPATVLGTQTWYRFTIHYPVGLLGRYGKKRTRMDLEFLDASGEGLARSIELDPKMAEQWLQAFADAQIMVFCLPIWAVFPYDDLDEPSLEFRKLLLDQYHQVHNNYLMTRERALEQGHALPKVQTILALTMADDDRCRLEEVRERWIKPYADQDIQYTLEKLGTERGLVQYLDDARAMSEAIRQEFMYSDDPEIQAIPTKLRIGGAEPWIIPVSAINGQKLEELKDRGYSPATRSAMPPPRPAHVELPILLALMQRHNAWS